MHARANQMLSWVAALGIVVVGLLASADFWAYPTPRPPEAVRLANTWSQMPR